jgi:iron complex transport system substrate-binding protein
MIRRLTFLLLTLTASIATIADVSVVDGRGKRVTLSSYPKRIVSLSPGTTEMLFAIGLKGRIVADTTYCDYPPAAKRLPHIGDVTISAEKVIAQRPDLVVASGSANRTAIQTLERLKLPVFAVDPSTFLETHRALRLLGEITGQKKEAEGVVKSMEAGVAAARKAIPKGALRPKLLWIVQFDPLIVVGRKSFMDDLITLAGAENGGRSCGDGWPTMSPERVVAMRPDIIIAGSQSAKRVKTRAAWSGVPAVANSRIYSLSSVEAVRPGPRLVDALKKLITVIHASGPRK